MFDISIPVCTYIKEFDRLITAEEENELKDLLRAGKIQSYSVTVFTEPFKSVVKIIAPFQKKTAISDGRNSLAKI